MTQEDRLNYSAVLLEDAHRCLSTAKSNVEISDYKAAANRSYYAIFHSMRALLILDDDFRSFKAYRNYCAVSATLYEDRDFGQEPFKDCDKCV